MSSHTSFLFDGQTKDALDWLHVGTRQTAERSFPRQMEVCANKNQQNADEMQKSEMIRGQILGRFALQAVGTSRPLGTGRFKQVTGLQRSHELTEEAQAEGFSGTRASGCGQGGLEEPHSADLPHRFACDVVSFCRCFRLFPQAAFLCFSCKYQMSDKKEARSTRMTCRAC